MTPESGFKPKSDFKANVFSIPCGRPGAPSPHPLLMQTPNSLCTLWNLGSEVGNRVKMEKRAMRCLAWGQGIPGVSQGQQPWLAPAVTGGHRCGGHCGQRLLCSWPLF